MTSFNTVLTKTERDAILVRRQTLKNRADSLSYTTASLDDLRKLLLDAVHHR